MIGGRSRLRVSGGRLLKGGTSMDGHFACCTERQYSSFGGMERVRVSGLRWRHAIGL